MLVRVLDWTPAVGGEKEARCAQGAWGRGQSTDCLRRCFVVEANTATRRQAVICFLEGGGNGTGSKMSDGLQVAS